MAGQKGLLLRPIDLEGLRKLYPTMAVDFPPDELKPLDKMERLMEEGISEGWLLMEGETPRGYAFFLRVPGEKLVLLDYYAIFPALRGQNLGSRGLDVLREQYPDGIFLEAESPNTAETQEERSTRQRRIAFYQRAGFVPCPFENSVFGVTYLVHLWTKKLPEGRNRLAARLLTEAYRCQLRPEIFQRQIQIQIPE